MNTKWIHENVPSSDNQDLPLIGISYLSDPLTDMSCFCNHSCFDGALYKAGARTIFLGYSNNMDEIESMLSNLDGLIMPGGADISPSLYGEEPISQTVGTNLDKDKYDYMVLAAAMKLKLPIWGICRSHQLINVYFGGDLWQDMESQCSKLDPGQIWNHRLINRAAHSVKILGGPLKEWFGERTLQVNSAHHQAVRKTANQLCVGAVSPDGIVESFYLSDYPFLLTTQWHPEFMTMWDDNSCILMERFVEVCKRK